ncbi:hypothetical protein GG681_08555 [Epibacterium sp. SM1969]|uniref:Lipoprotein n=1 Tax=Tritonibacter aquimaris TaxID=2663379 RepID=A0A844AXP6_9RHOB|nr:hypothetical protein [Tritonibacter aquimaris]MQY42692.1 hypothetical protein [Tritonibacter aquimaris]
MKFTLSLLIIVAAVSACGGPKLTAEQKALRDRNVAQNQAALAVAKHVALDGQMFRVAHVTERNQALVERVKGSGPYYVRDLQVAAYRATGCGAKFDAGILAFIGGDIYSADLADLRTKVSGKFDGWGVSLEC